MTNNIDPDQDPCNVVFDLASHCLLKQQKNTRKGNIYLGSSNQKLTKLQLQFSLKESTSAM